MKNVNIGHVEDEPNFTINTPLNYGKIDHKTVQAINDTVPDTVTRYMSHEDLEKHLIGGIKFGTLEGYGKIEDKALSRLGDDTEGRRREIIRPLNGDSDFIMLNGVRILNMEFSSKNPVVEIIKINDYCSCYSIGSASSKIADEIVSAGNLDVDAYVTYNSAKLIKSMEKYFSRLFGKGCFSLLYKSINYGEKDKILDVGKSYFSLRSSLDKLLLWQSAAFTKPVKFRHEREFRILCVPYRKIGSLPIEAPSIIIKNKGIKESIIEHGRL